MAIEGVQATLRAVVDPRGARAGARTAADEIAKIGRSARTSGQQVGEMETRMARIGRVARQLSAVLGVSLAAAASSVFVGGIKSAKDYSAELSKTSDLVGIARDEVDKMGEGMLEMAARVGKSPQELAEGLFFITSAGLRGAKAMDALEKSAMASAAGLGETKVIADAVTSAMNAYAKEGMTAAKATGVLVAAVREGKAEASEIAGALGQVLGLASAAGVSFEEVAGTVATLTRVGINAAESVTALKATISAILTPTADQDKLFKSLGFSASQLITMLRDEGVLPVMQLLEKATGGNVEMLAKLIPNIRALTGVMGILSQESAAVQQIFDVIGKEAGQSLIAAFQGASGELEHKLNALTAAWRVELIQIGTKALPKLISLVENLTAVLPALSTAVGVILDTTLQLGGAALAIYALNKSFLVLHGTVILIQMLLAGSFARTFVMSMAAGRAATIATIASLKTMRTQIGLAGAAIAGWQIGSQLYENSKSVRLFAASMLEVILGAVERIKYGWTALTIILAREWETFTDSVATVTAVMLDGIANAMQNVPGFDTLSKQARGAADSLWRISHASRDFDGELKTARETLDKNLESINLNTQAGIDYEAGINASTFALQKLNEELDKNKDKPPPTAVPVSFELDTEGAEKLDELMGKFMPERAEMQELEDALTFVENAVERIQEKVAAGLAAELNGVSLQDFNRLYDELLKKMEEFDPGVQHVKDLTEAYEKLFEDTRSPFEELTERRAELLRMERELIAIYPLQAESIHNTIIRALQEADDKYNAFLKTQNKLPEEIERANNAAKDLGLTFTSAFEDAVIESGKFSDILEGLEKDIMRIILRLAITQPLTGALTGFFQNIIPGAAATPAKGSAGGNPMRKGEVSVVGERGPELAVANASGFIMSHEDSVKVLRRVFEDQHKTSNEVVNQVEDQRKFATSRNLEDRRKFAVSNQIEDQHRFAVSNQVEDRRNLSTSRRLEDERKFAVSNQVENRRNLSTSRKLEDERKFITMREDTSVLDKRLAPRTADLEVVRKAANAGGFISTFEDNEENRRRLTAVKGSAQGNPMRKGELTVVGERGPELGFANASGFIMSHESSVAAIRKAFNVPERSADISAVAAPPQVEVKPVIHSNTRIQVINQGGGPEPEVKTTRQSDGSEFIQIIVGAVTRDLSRDGPMAKAMKSKFGLRNTTGQR